jgi:Protein of unknown function (DUF2971)
MNLIDEHLGKIPEHPLYHYTTATGLLGILKGRSLWASSTRHLNDSRELVYAIEVVKEELAKRSSGLEGLYGSLEWSPDRGAQSLLKRLDKITNSTYYVASFSRQKDVLSQWRAYCKEGNGYAIGFKPENLIQLKNSDRYLVQCIYEPKKQRTLCNALIDSYLTLDEDLRETSGSLWKGHKVSQWSEKVLILALAIKHKGFNEEAEWRLIVKESDKDIVNFRPGRFGVVPYLDVQLLSEDEKLLVAELVVGPNEGSEASRRSAEKLMEKYAYRPQPPPIFQTKPYEITLSSITYRN